MNWGASREDWFNFSILYGLQEDLIPIVSNPHAKISPNSKLKSVGKTPSVYSNGLAVGLADWTNKRATAQEISKWERVPDYGIGVIAREAKSIDIDIDNYDTVKRIKQCVNRVLGFELPCRFRSNSAKALLIFRLSAETDKHIIKTGDGAIEILGDRQQFLVAGTHPSGVRYEWGGLGAELPTITHAQFDSLVKELQAQFGTEPIVNVKGRERQSIRDIDEPIYNALITRGLIKSYNRDGSVNIVCPYSHEHTTESTESSTVYYPAHTGGYAHASIKCLHAHCSHRKTEDFKETIGLGVLDDFEDISDQVFTPPVKKPGCATFSVVPALDFANSGTAPRWLVKYLIPEKGIISIFGPSQSGKTFLVFDLIASIARGVSWKDRKTIKGTIVYVCAEGAYFFKNRIKAYLIEHGLEDIDIYVIDAQPNLMKPDETRNLITSVKQAIPTPVSFVVLDTYAACMIGDENSGLDVGKVLNNCKMIRNELNAAVGLIHHAGKDLTRGARGHSSLRAGVDTELQIVREGNIRGVTVTKQKDGPDGGVFGFELKAVPLGIDEDGDPIESCVVVHTDVLPLIAEPGRKISAKKSQVYSGLHQYHGEFDCYPKLDELCNYMEARHGEKPSAIQKNVRELEIEGKVFVDATGVINPSDNENLI